MSSSNSKKRSYNEASSDSNSKARWAIVNSDSDSDSNCDPDIDSRSYSSYSESSNSSDSECESKKKDKHKLKDSKHSKHKKEKKEKKSHHDKHKRKDHKKHKKEHKHGKHSKEHRKSSSSGSAAVNQNEYGKYGIIREDHYFQKQREFEHYMIEVKKFPNISLLSKREIVQHFQSYMEDYNTATLPHIKYYNYDTWELEQYQKEQMLKQKEANRKPDFVYDDDDLGLGLGSSSGVTDEELRRRELLQQRQIEANQSFLKLKESMKTDTTGLMKDIRRQDQLKGELRLAYKYNDMETVKKLERLLEPSLK